MHITCQLVNLFTCQLLIRGENILLQITDFIDAYNLSTRQLVYLSTFYHFTSHSYFFPFCLILDEVAMLLTQRKPM